MIYRTNQAKGQCLFCSLISTNRNTVNDITTIDDIKLLVDSFYSQIKIDPLLGPIFEHVIKDNWTPHLEKMYRFWQTLLLYEHTYTGSPFPVHAHLPIDKGHFDQWLHLFNQTVDTHFKGPNADEAKSRAEKMGALFHYKIQYLREHPEN